MGRRAKFDAERKAALLAAMARTATLKAACAEAGVGTSSVHWALPRDQAFALAYAKAAAKQKALAARGGGEARRHDGFTGKKRRKFLKTLRKTGCVSDACRSAGISSTAAYRARSQEAEFARQWKTALSIASSELEAIAWQRAVEGVEEQVIRDEKVVTRRIVRSDALLRMLLIGSNPKKYGRMGRARVGPSRKEKMRMEEEMRARIVAEEEAKREETRRKLEAKLSEMNRRMGGNG